MQANEALITRFFNDYRQYGEVSASFSFDVFADLYKNDDIPKSALDFLVERQYRNSHEYARAGRINPLNLHAEDLKSLTGLDFSFVLKGYDQTFKHKNIRHNEFDEDFLHGHKGNAYETREMQANARSMARFKNLFQQLKSVIQCMVGYYNYSLSIDYSTLLKKWEEAVPSLYMTCSKEVRELNAVISSNREANTFFKSRYQTFVQFIVDSKEFINLVLQLTGRSQYVGFDDGFNNAHRFGNAHGFSSFFGHQSPFQNRTAPTINESFKAIFEDQEKRLTDFIEANTDILVVRDSHELFNQSTLIADYKKVLKICEILIEKTNIHMNCKHLKAISFLDTYAQSHDEIVALTNFDEKFRELNIVAILNNIKNSSITAAIVFNDSSVVVKKKGYEGFQYSPTSFVGDDLIIDGYVDEINHMLRKNPSMNKSVKVLLKNLRSKHVNNIHVLYNSLKGLKIGLKSYFDNENILKAHAFDMINELKTSRTFEEFDDKIHKVVRKHKIEQYAMSIVSNKYKNLYSDKTFSIMEELYDMGISTHILQDMIGKKMASIKNTRSLNAALKSLLSSINGFEISNIKMKAKANNVKILFEAEDYLVLEIDNFKQSKAMGSPSWCISRDDYHFNSYTEGGNIQVFAYDFSLTSKDNKSIVGVTLTRGMKVHAAHNKNDTELRDKATKEKLIKIVADAKGIVLKTVKPKAA